MIVQNAGGEGSIVLEKVRSSKDDKYGYNALTDTYEDLVAAGVIDPTKVTRTALQNAASIAGLLLTTEAIVVEKKEEKSAAPAGGPGGGMGGNVLTESAAGDEFEAGVRRSGPRFAFVTRMNSVMSSRVAAALLAACVASTNARAQTADPHIGADSLARARDLPASAFRNANGSPRLRDDQYAVVRARVVPLLERWARDPRLAIDPAYVTALILKESGRRFARRERRAGARHRAAHGGRRLGHAPHGDRVHFQWMAPEVNRGARSAVLRSNAITALAIDSMLARGSLTSRQDYLLSPTLSARAAVFWIRLLENKWTTDFWPGGYGTAARKRLNAGKPLTNHQMFDLVTISYNRGYIQVKSLVDRYGPAWTSHLAELPGGEAEAADYLERVRTYASLLQAAPTSADDSAR